MKIRQSYLIAAVFIAGFTEAVFAIENPAGMATVPPSSLGGSLVTTPNPIDTSGNLVITGNVGGGRQFRGTVPYQSTSDFWAGLGSASLDSFMRRSYVSPGRELYTTTYQPYYSPSGTVTTMQGGQVQVGGLPVRKVDDRAGGDVSILAVPRMRAGLSEGLSLQREGESYGNLEVFPNTGLETGVVSLPGVGTYRRGEQTTDGVLQDQAALQALRRRSASFEQFRTDSEFAQFRAELRQLPLETALERNLPYQYEMPRVGQEGRKSAEDIVEDSGRDDGLLQIQSEESVRNDILPGADSTSAGAGEPGGIFGPQKSMEQAGEASPYGFSDEGGAGTDAARSLASGGLYEQIKRQIEGMQKGVTPLDEFDRQTELSRNERAGDRAGVSVADRAREILGPHESFSSYSKEKFGQYMKAADDYLKQGEYYRAADSYSLAMIYQKGDPRACAGRGHALFAAGEYISSALFISRALEAFGGAAKAGAEGPQQKDATSALIALRGNFGAIDRDDLEKRIVEAEEWRKTSDVGELHFLLAYIYYQMGRVEPAKAAIEKVYEQMPQAPAVIMLKSVIESTANRGTRPTGAPQDPGR